MKKLDLFIIVFFVSLLCSCASYSKRFNNQQAINPPSAYLFGRLLFNDNTPSIMAGRLHVSLKLQNISTREHYLFELLPNDEISVFDIQPGSYQFTEVLYAYHLGQIASTSPINDSQLQGTDLTPGLDPVSQLDFH